MGNRTFDLHDDYRLFGINFLDFESILTVSFVERGGSNKTIQISFSEVYYLELKVEGIFENLAHFNGVDYIGFVPREQVGRPELFIDQRDRSESDDLIIMFNDGGYLRVGSAQSSGECG
jgi:hypothetical protein